MLDNSINASVESPLSSRAGSPIPPLVPARSASPLPVRLRVSTPYPTPELPTDDTGRAIFAALQTINPPECTTLDPPLLNPVRMFDDPSYQGPPLSPRSALDLLQGNPAELTVTLLTNIVKCLTETIKKREEDHKKAIDSFDDTLNRLQEKVLHYEDTFSIPPPGYIENNGHYPNLQILTAKGIYRPAKWVKQMDNLRVACLADTDVGSATPSIIDVYAGIDHSDQPVVPFPDWLLELVTGPAAAYAIVQNQAGDLEDWGVGADLDRLRTAHNQMVDAYKQVDAFSALASMHGRTRDAVQSRLELAKASHYLSHLKGLSDSRAHQQSRNNKSAWKQAITNASRGREA